jgi:hypothetical protein
MIKERKTTKYVKQISKQTYKLKRRRGSRRSVKMGRTIKENWDGYWAKT